MLQHQFLHRVRLNVEIHENNRTCTNSTFAEVTHSADHTGERKTDVLQPLIPDRPPSSYDLRPRTHDKLLLDKTTYLNDREFVIRVLYRDSY